MPLPRTAGKRPSKSLRVCATIRAAWQARRRLAMTDLDTASAEQGMTERNVLYSCKTARLFLAFSLEV